MTPKYLYIGLQKVAWNHLREIGLEIEGNTLVIEYISHLIGHCGMYGMYITYMTNYMLYMMYIKICILYMMYIAYQSITDLTGELRATQVA